MSAFSLLFIACLLASIALVLYGTGYGFKKRPLTAALISLAGVAVMFVPLVVIVSKHY